MKYSANLQRFAFAAALTLAALVSPSFLSAQTSAVKVWEKDTVIPTYLAGDPEPNPMFFFGRQSQGAQGKVYP